MKKPTKILLTLATMLIAFIGTLLFLRRRHAAEQFTNNPRTLVVTAYYPLHKNKHGHQKYVQWIRYFFEGVSCDIICFCPSNIHSELVELAGENSKVKFVIREFDSFDMMSPAQMEIWRKCHEMDDHKDIHSPELYAVWAAKQEFVRTAIEMESADIYVWCDIGAFREKRPCDFKNTYKYVKPGKITSLAIIDLIGGGILAGDAVAWRNFSTLYLRELNANPHRMDQVIYRRILNDSNANIISAPSTEKRDHWFYLLYIFTSV